MIFLDNAGTTKMFKECVETYSHFACEEFYNPSAVSRQSAFVHEKLEGVRKLMRQTNFPGMKVLEFAFDGNPDNEHKPSNYVANCICYTGTHDNSPLKGYLLALDDYAKTNLIGDLTKELTLLKIKPKLDTIDDIIDDIIELAFASKANICIIPWQDFLHQGEEARMNHPSTLSTANWSYYTKKTDFKKNISNKIARLVAKYDR